MDFKNTKQVAALFDSGQIRYEIEQSEKWEIDF